MPRGVKRVIDYSQEMSELDAKIQKHQAAISALNERKSEISNLQKQEEVKRLTDFLERSGMTIEQVINQIQSKDEESA